MGSKSILNKYFRFFLNIWSPTVAFFVLTIIAATYLYSEYQADHANNLRIQSILLADELRQSSDDLTRMVRTYVATGDTLYKQHYQDILDIRNGKLPRPIKYENIYWDLVLEDDRRPRQNSDADPLLERMQRVGFTKTELAKLEQAKTNSDMLVNTENAAMALIESTDPINDANRLKAIQMLNDSVYHQAKASIMRPINEFYQLMEQRTQEVVQLANRMARILRMVFIAFTIIWVITLKAQAAQSKQAKEALQASENNYRNVVQDQTEFIMRYLPDGTRTFVNDSYCRTYNLIPEQVIGKSFLKEIPKTESQRLKRKIAELSPDNPIITDEHESITPEGNKVWHTWTDRGIFDDNGKLKEIQAVGRDITEHKQAEEEVRKLSVAIIQSPSVIAITDLKGDLEYVNHKFTELTGYTSEEVIGQNPNILKSGEHSDEMYKELWETISSGKKWRGELHNKKKNGELFWEATSISPIFDKQGERTNYIKFAEDITERKAAEIALVKSRESLAEAQRIAHLGSWEWIAATDTPTWSKELCTMLEVDPDKPVPSLAEQDTLYTPDSMDRMRSAVEKTMQTGDPYEIELERVREDGSRRWLLSRGARWFNDNGQLIGMRGTALDITKRKQAEEEIISTRDYANNLIESSLDMIIAVNLKRTITEFNKAAEETFGYKLSEVIGKHVNLLYANPKEGLKVHKQTVLHGHHVQEILNKRKNGGIFTSLLSASVLKDIEGNQIGVMGVSRDITEDKEAEEKFRNYVSKIKGINEASHVLTHSLDSKYVIDRCIDITKEMFEADSVTLFILEKDGERSGPHPLDTFS